MIYDYIILKPRACRKDENKDEHRMGVYFEMNMALGYEAARDIVRVQLERADLELAEAAWKDSVEREHYKSTITANFIWNPIRNANEKIALKALIDPAKVSAPDWAERAIAAWQAVVDSAIKKTEEKPE